MTLEEQATLMRAKLDNITLIATEGMDLCDKVLEKHDLNDETVEWSTENKQKFINRGLALISELKALVEELP